MLLFTTLELGPTSQKGTPFWVHFGDLFSQKNEKRGFQTRPQNQSQKMFKMGPKQGGVFLTVLGAFFTSEPCSDPLCCWNAPGPLFFIILASLFLHFCVAARYKEQLFVPPPQTGGGKITLFYPPSPNWGRENYTFGRCLGSELCSDPIQGTSFFNPPKKLGGDKNTFFYPPPPAFWGD